MNITLDRVTDTEGARIVRNMFTAYFFDLSPYDDNLVINRFGLPTWAPAGLPGPMDHEQCVRLNWWIRGSAEGYVIRADDNPAGFLHIIRDRNHLPVGVDQDLLDFYVAPKCRRTGIGSRAARIAFDLYPGTWQVCELPRNLPARAFWHRVIADYSGGSYEDLDNGTVQRFTRP